MPEGNPYDGRFKLSGDQTSTEALAILSRSIQGNKHKLRVALTSEQFQSELKRLSQQLRTKLVKTPKEQQDVAELMMRRIEIVRKELALSYPDTNLIEQHLEAVLPLATDLTNTIPDVLRFVTQFVTIVKCVDTSFQTVYNELTQLVQSLQTELQKVPADHSNDAEVIAETATAVVVQSSKSQPNKTILRVLAEGLKQAAMKIATELPDVLPIAVRIVELTRTGLT